MNGNDLTRGAVAPQLIRYAVPLIAINALQALYSIVDLMIVGQFVGSTGIVAVTNAGQVVGFLSQIAIAMTVGGNVLVGRHFGSGQADERKASAGALCVFSLVLGVVFTFGLYALAGPMIRLLGAQESAEAVGYIRLSAIGFLPIFGYHALSAILRGVGESKGPFYCIMAASGANVLLDLLFVGGFGWGVYGAAIATVLAQGVAFLTILLVYALPKGSFYGLERRWLVWDGPRIWAIIRLSLPIAFQQAIIAVSWLYVLAVINGYGADVVAGYGISAKIRDFCQLLITAMMTATSSMIAQCLGAGDIPRTRQVLRTAMGLDIAMATITILLVEVAAPVLAGVFTQDTAVVQVAVTNLRIEIMGQWFFSIFYMYHALAIGAGHTLFVSINSFLNCIIVRISLLYFLGSLVGIIGIYWILMISTSVSILPALIYERSGIWKRSAVLG